MRLVGSIHDVSAKPSGLPCCPRCGGVLVEVESETAWWASVDEHEAAGHPGYREFVEWLRGRCYRTMDAAQGAFDLEALQRRAGN